MAQAHQDLRFDAAQECLLPPPNTRKRWYGVHFKKRSFAMKKLDKVMPLMSAEGSNNDAEVDLLD